jgi:hypothetical protein
MLKRPQRDKQSSLLWMSPTLLNSANIAVTYYAHNVIKLFFFHSPALGKPRAVSVPEKPLQTNIMFEVNEEPT